MAGYGVTSINYIAMVVLIGAGIFMIYEGSTYIKMKHSNPDIPDTIYAAAVLAIIIGFCEIVFGVAHFWFV